MNKISKVEWVVILVVPIVLGALGGGALEYVLDGRGGVGGDSVESAPWGSLKINGLGEEVWAGSGAKNTENEFWKQREMEKNR